MCLGLTILTPVSGQRSIGPAEAGPDVHRSHVPAEAGPHVLRLHVRQFRRVAAWVLAVGIPAAGCSSSPTAPAKTTETAPSIATQPQSQTIAAGAVATLTMSATGAGPLAYQWYQGSTGVTSDPIGGATAATYTTPALNATTSYWARVSNAGGRADSATATVTVSNAPAPPAPPPSIIAPAITSQPANQSVTSGQSASLSVAATGTAPLSFQWYSGASGDTSSPIANGTSSFFTTPALTTTTGYWVRVSNSAGSVNSATAVVTVSAPPPAGSSVLEEEVLVLVNQRRAAGATCGGTFYPAVPPLTLDLRLRDAARGHSQDMAANNYASHTSLDGRTFDQRILQAGYTGGYPLGEYVAAGQSTAQAVVDGLMGSAAIARAS